ncbi:MAG TPA: DUF2959 domain-containing protein [Anaerohalosphaeraceae bacterium]|nr:DUF2959 domain-containing protein [Phycisphaerae bacterium]HOK95402.1 DUF2959 domain-containing protein [Anaerohalosphaeraceae bacterium]HOL32005.1 DUF2959 domain-containing protein [Anaerohalosphaeraceae bacterium]HOM76520.1 DUF2959 domain-containing protein [Anaerohalosphaeraceae bacterium]HPC64788.1 DUF2959 domain-containing protein [Anaerohalosphaeraceae bacterium]
MKPIPSQLCTLLAALAAITAVAGCQKVYYGTMEKFGVHKRDILVSNVAQARDAQNEAKAQFASALEEFSAVANFQGGKLEEKYKTLNAEYQRCQKKAEAVKERIGDVKRVAKALFEEWEKELDQYSSDALRKASQAKLEQTQQRYKSLIGAMERAESKIAPVLAAFGDQVLFLKHNLNAQAVASLQSELSTMESEIGTLIREMERSINEADAFIQEMTQQES